MNGAYGEYAKLLNTGGCLDQLAAFVEWLPSQNIHIMVLTGPVGENVRIPPRELAARFYGIDLAQAETEKARMTESFHQAKEYLTGEGNPVVE